MKRSTWRLSLSLMFVLAACHLLAQEQPKAEAYSIFKQGLELEKGLLYFKAREKFAEAIARDPNNAGYLEHYAWFLHENGWHEEAITVFIKALPLAENKKAMMGGLAFNLKKVGKLEESLEQYRQLYEVPDASQGLRDVFGDISNTIHNENAARIREVEASIAQNPDDANLQRELMKLHISQGKFKEARSIGERIQASFADDLSFQLTLARTMFWSGDKEAAEQSLVSLKEKAPQSSYLSMSIAEVQAAAGKKSEAESALREALAAQPESARVRKQLAEVLAENKQLEQAIAILPKAAEPEWLTGELARARTYHFSGELKTAIPIYRQILDQYPHNEDALWGLSECLVYSGKLAAASDVMKLWSEGVTDDRFQQQQNLMRLYSAPRIGLRVAGYENSADFTRMDAGVYFSISPLLRTRFNASYTFSEFRQNRFEDVTRHSIFVDGEFRATEQVGLFGKIGLNDYDNDETGLNGIASLLLDPREWLKLSLSYEHLDVIDTEPAFGNQIYNHAVTIGSVGLHSRTDNFVLYMELKPADRVDIVGKVVQGHLSDDNEKVSYFIEGNYTLSKKPMVQIGYGYFYLDYDDPAPVYTENNDSIEAYYDPRNLEVHTVNAKWNHRVHPHWQFGLEKRVSYIPKSDGIANSLFGYVTYSWQDKNSLRLDARTFYQNRGINREGESGHFSANSFTLAYERRF